MKKTIFILFSVCLLFVASGCVQNQKPAPKPSKKFIEVEIQNGIKIMVFIDKILTVVPSGDQCYVFLISVRSPLPVNDCSKFKYDLTHNNG